MAIVLMRKNEACARPMMPPAIKSTIAQAIAMRILRRLRRRFSNLDSEIAKRERSFAIQLLYLGDFVLADIRLQDFRNTDRAVFLLIVFHDGNERAAHGECRSIV